ncbi:MAG: hypothetical protein KIS78_28095, partial [Labilithrix sp.]|nr:hypothetical protein [Labilithrix sp.]
MQNSRAPAPPQVAQTPPAPRVASTSPAPSPPASKASEPPESGWDDATQLPSSAVIPAADEARGGAAVAPPSDAEAGPVP